MVDMDGVYVEVVAIIEDTAWLRFRDDDGSHDSNDISLAAINDVASHGHPLTWPMQASKLLDYITKGG